MKEFFSNFKIPIIFGGCAVAAIIATLIVISGGFSSDYGMYITSAYGSVSITNSDNVMSPANGDRLKEGDVLTVGTDSSCTLTYKGKKNSENNYLVVGADTQLVVMSEFNGKDEGEIFVRSGTVIANYADKDNASFSIRTADSSITTAESVSKISYYTNEFMSYTDLYTFMGSSQIQLYDAVGNMVNNAEMQIQKKWGRVVSEDGPSFEALNLEINLNELSAFDLKTLITIANIAGENFPYTAAELKAVYDTKADNSNGVSVDEQPTETTTAVTEPIDTSDSVQTVAPVVTTNSPPTVTTLPGQTTTTAKTNPPATTTTADTTTQNNVYHVVAVVIDGEETLQEVPHGGNAVKPADPQIDGLTFIGWDSSFENITEDRTITAMFDEAFGNGNNQGGDSTSVFTHTVTVVIGDKTTTIQVAHGESANLPVNVNIDGYIFQGWDKDYSKITEDITITAILVKNTHTVTFVIENDRFEVEVAHGEDAMPPYLPSADSNGNRFVSWDKSLGNITNDITITAVFDNDNYHTVTFIIDGEFYTVRVAHGETAVPPFQPITNSMGSPFWGWDTSLENITSDVVITAYYG